MFCRHKKFLRFSAGWGLNPPNLPFGYASECYTLVWILECWHYCWFELMWLLCDCVLYCHFTFQWLKHLHPCFFDEFCSYRPMFNQSLRNALPYLLTYGTIHIALGIEGAYFAKAYCFVAVRQVKVLRELYWKMIVLMSQNVMTDQGHTSVQFVRNDLRIRETWINTV